MVWLAPCLAAVVLGGCGKKKENDKPAEKVVAKEGDKKPAEPPKKVGLEDPTSDPKIVAAAKQVIADCGKTMEEKSGEKTKMLDACDKFGATFGDQKFEKAEVTMVNFLEDPDVRVRFMGLVGLHRFAYAYKEDKALVGRVLDALKKEKAPSPIDHLWVQRVSRLPADDADVDAKLKAIGMDAAASNDVKVSIMSWWPGAAGYELVKANAASTDAAMVKAVAQGYGQQFANHADEACAYWAAHLETPDADTNDVTLGHLTGGYLSISTKDTESTDSISGDTEGPSSRNEKRCTAEQQGKALDVIEKKFAAGDSGDVMPRSLGFLANDKLTSKEIKERAVKDLKAMVEKKGYFPGREALRQLNEAGDPAMVKYAQKFSKDADLKETVDEIVKASKEKKNK
ncbi:MAG TPA: hypothetical protein VMZ53_18470 [Kofleriaceae bacterium]|nr:hypothetical protein [Kofleriaceae bacterium]